MILKPTITCKPLLPIHVSTISRSFCETGWHKPESLFESYLDETQKGERLVWVALNESDNVTGYVTLKWQSEYLSFRQQNIPEIVDLNVLPTFRNKGIATLMLDKAEAAAALQSDVIGIGVGLYAGVDGGYGAAQRLYIKRGYIPDGKGVTYNYEPVVPGNNYPVDDNLILWMTKNINR